MEKTQKKYQIDDFFLLFFFLKKNRIAVPNGANSLKAPIHDQISNLQGVHVKLGQLINCLKNRLYSSKSLQWIKG
jgi:Tfp pilus assembly protein PilZ